MPSSLRKAVNKAARLTGIVKPASPQALRHCLAPYPPESQYGRYQNRAAGGRDLLGCPARQLADYQRLALVGRTH